MNPEAYDLLKENQLFSRTEEMIEQARGKVASVLKLQIDYNNLLCTINCINAYWLSKTFQYKQ